MRAEACHAVAVGCVRHYYDYKYRNIQSGFIHWRSQQLQLLGPEPFIALGLNITVVVSTSSLVRIFICRVNES